MVAFLRTKWKRSGILPHFTTHTNELLLVWRSDEKGKEVKQTEDNYMYLCASVYYSILMHFVLCIQDTIYAKKHGQSG